MSLEKNTCAQHATTIKNLATHDNNYLFQQKKTKKKLKCILKGSSKTTTKLKKQTPKGSTQQQHISLQMITYM